MSFVWHGEKGGRYSCFHDILGQTGTEVSLCISWAMVKHDILLPRLSAKTFKTAIVMSFMRHGKQCSEVCMSFMWHYKECGEVFISIIYFI